ncbi:MAG: 30S ribosomal protein S12 methylthiotransferase RimO [Chloroflexi bacterium]|nr:30S ribosomal protein S12 methylthiotransferase RimO [Chloroflexota bacterium]
MRYYLRTLGCAKNVADSDGIGSLLENAGMRAADNPRDADVLIVNTCGFLQAARAESLAAMRELGESKRAGQLLIGAGCLISRYGAQVKSDVPQVDGVIDAGKWLALPRFIEHLKTRETFKVSRSASEVWFREAYLNLPREQIAARSVVERLPRVARGPSAFLKIADGCDRPCTFCIIPAIKGAHHSKTPDAVIAEARELVAQGVKEIALVAQDSTAYGWDLGQRDALAPLMEKICDEVLGERRGDSRGRPHWLRLMYAYPGHVTPRLIETMARLPQIVKYIDVPLQHAHPETLKRMRRPNSVVTCQMLDALRAAMPDIAIRTTFIVGFPGETEKEFETLLQFIEEQQFDRVGVFEFSVEEGTPSATMSDQIPAKIKKRRREQAMALQQEISLKKNQRFVGKTLEVLIEGAGDGVSIGRTYRDAPEVDGVVIIEKELPAGEFARVKITRAVEYDLMGELED